MHPINTLWVASLSTIDKDWLAEHISSVLDFVYYCFISHGMLKRKIAGLGKPAADAAREQVSGWLARESKLMDNCCWRGTRPWICALTTDSSSLDHPHRQLDLTNCSVPLACKLFVMNPLSVCVRPHVLLCVHMCLRTSIWSCVSDLVCLNMVVKSFVINLLCYLGYFFYEIDAKQQLKYC
jgi:hypothetical protein